MKAISIQNPFADFIMYGEKTIEVRTWNTEHRGDLLICSSASPKIPGMISGHALCIVSLDNVTKLKRKDLKAACIDEMPSESSYAWHFSNVRIVKPFPVKGKLNFYYIEDEKIEVIDDGTLTDEERNEVFSKIIMPMSYKYGKIGAYYRTNITEDLIRWRVGQDALEYISPMKTEWQFTTPDSEYERAFYEGSETCELKMIKDKEAQKILNSWNIPNLNDK